MSNLIFKKTKKNSGYVTAIASLFFLLISTAIISTVSSPINSQIKTNRDLDKSKDSFFSAETENEEIIYRLKNGMDLPVGEYFSISDLGGGVKEILTTGDVDGRIRKIKSQIQTASGTSFNYGLFSGRGGIEMDNNSVINGSVYSNGNVIGSNNSIIRGDVTVAMSVPEDPSLQSIVKNSDYQFGMTVGSENRLDVMQNFVVNEKLNLVRLSLFLKKIGSPSDLNIKIVRGRSDHPDKNSIVATGKISASLVGSNYSFVDVLLSDNSVINAGEVHWFIIDGLTNANNSNYYVWGFDNQNSFALGEGKYAGDWKNYNTRSAGGDFNFKLWMADLENHGVIQNISLPLGEQDIAFSARAYLMDNVDVSGNAYAHTFFDSVAWRNVFVDELMSSFVFGDAHYNFIDGSYIFGNSITPTDSFVESPFLPMPISESDILDWENLGTSGGVISTARDFTPVNNEIIGPGVVEGNLILESGRNIKLNGIVYVKGYVKFMQNSNLILFDSNNDAMIITDSNIYLNNNSRVNYFKTGQGRIALVSVKQVTPGDWYYENRPAIDVYNNVQVDVLVAPFGGIRIGNNFSGISLMGDKIILNENTILNYEEGLTDMNFSSGPSGTWEISEWKEVE